MSPIIQVQNIGKSFGKYSIIEDLSLQINEGTVYGLVGLNGAGKTTLLRLLLGILKPDKGDISILNANPWTHNSDIYKNMGVVLEHDGFWGNLTVKENLSIYSAAKGISDQETKNYLQEYWRDTDIINTDKKVKHLSRGQKMQCALCRAFLGWPTLFLLDEPALALDITAYDHFCTMVRAARDRGAALIISSHQLDTIDQLCSRVGILRDKNLKELQSNDRSNLWKILTDHSPVWEDLIQKSGGYNLKYDQGWTFEINDPDSSIPQVIYALASAGCSIKEVRRLECGSGFGEAIRNLYSSTQNGLRK